jgi:hypothetical protein
MQYEKTKYVMTTPHQWSAPCQFQGTDENKSTDLIDTCHTQGTACEIYVVPYASGSMRKSTLSLMRAAVLNRTSAR